MASILKCKMCGGDIKLSEDKTLGVCESCGSTTTFPKVSDEKRVAAFNRGNFYRRTGEFDKALSIYEQIILEDDTDAEAHWCAAISRFGIEYVEDPVSMEYFPTCHRASFDSFLEDIDVKAAIEHSESGTRRQYQKEANKISEVQKGILATSINEEPFDIFICYKETDDLGRRTQDSVLAQDIYYRLTDEGFKVFFSRITLEDKAGSEYEPYIFAALNSAKVMIVIGTKKEYLDSVWVKNEWSRFISLMKKDRTRVVLPCYKEMNPYDMPDALASLQSYDMTTIGFVQDLIRGIKKIIHKNENKASNERNGSSDSSHASLEALVKNGFLALEEHAWDKANDFFEKSMEINPQMSEIYLGKVLLTERCGTVDDFAKKKINRLKSVSPEEVVVYVVGQDLIAKEIEEKTIQNYLSANEIKSCFTNGDCISSYVTAYQNEFKVLKEYFQKNTNMSRAYRYANGSTKDNLERLQKYLVSCYSKSIKDAEEADQKNTRDILEKYSDMEEYAYQKLNDAYESALKRRENDYQDALTASTEIKKQDDAMRIRDAFLKIGDYKDSLSLARSLEDKAKELADKERRKKKVIIFLSCSLFSVAIILAVIMIYVVVPKVKYNSALKAIGEGNYDYAYEIFISLGLDEEVTKNKYERANELLNKSEYEEARLLFDEISDYEDASEKSLECYIAQGDLLTSQGKYEDALKYYNKGNANIGKFNECKTKWAKSLVDEKKYEDAYKLYSSLDHKKAVEVAFYLGKEYYENENIDKAYEYLKIAKERSGEPSNMFSKISYEYGCKCLDEKKYSQAAEALKDCNYENASEKYLEATYRLAEDNLFHDKYKEAVDLFSELGDYENSKEKRLEAMYEYVVHYKLITDPNTNSYTKELMQAGYKDINKISKEIFQWKVTVTAVNNSEKSSTNMSSLSKYDDWYFHIKLEGGELNKSSTEIKYKCVFPDNSTVNGKFENKWSKGWTGFCYFFYNNPARGAAGTIQCFFYDSEGNEIGHSERVRVTD